MGQKSTLKYLMQAAMVCALLIILGLFPGIPLGIIPVAVVLQNLGVMLAGEILPARYGTLAVGVFLLLVALGLPFYQAVVAASRSLPDRLVGIWWRGCWRLR